MTRVLIVEDDFVLSLLLTKMIQKMNMEVVSVVTEGRKAIECVKEMNPDIILMDIMLEDDIDGIEAVSYLQNENNFTPVIFITGNSDTYNRNRANSIEFVDYLVKPIKYPILKEAIDKVKH